MRRRAFHQVILQGFTWNALSTTQRLWSMRKRTQYEPRSYDLCLPSLWCPEAPDGNQHIERSMGAGNEGVTIVLTCLCVFWVRDAAVASGLRSMRHHNLNMQISNRLRCNKKTHFELFKKILHFFLFKEYVGFRDLFTCITEVLFCACYLKISR